MEIVFATNNKNKVKEIQAMLPNITLLTLFDINCVEDIPETSPTIAQNAVQKSKYIEVNYGVDCFADDTGLEIEALNGAPGVYSARYAGLGKSAEKNMQKVLQNLEGITNRNAQFKTVISLSLDGETHTFEGVCKGHITTQKQGKKGFGYDPIFIPNGYDKTFAQMTMEEKAGISHRGIAVKKLVAFLESYNKK